MNCLFPCTRPVPDDNESAYEPTLIVPTPRAVTPTAPPSSPGPVLLWQLQKDRRFAVLFSEQPVGFSYPEAEFMVNKLFTFSEPQVLIPQGAVLIAVSSDNFRVGRSPYDFHPTRGNLEGSLTFQNVAFGITATLYNFKGKEYLAGLTYHVKGPQNFKDRQAFEHTWMLRRRFPDEHVVHDEPKYGRDCQLAGGRVLVGCDGGSCLVHFKWDSESKQYKTEHCVECEAVQSTSSTVVAANLGIQLVIPPLHLSPAISLADTLDDASELEIGEISSTFSQVDTEEAEE